LTPIWVIEMMFPEKGMHKPGTNLVSEVSELLTVQLVGSCYGLYHTKAGGAG